MRREIAEKSWADKFVALGLSNQFRFVGRDWKSDHGKKVNLKCRHCGAAFSTWSFHEVIKGRRNRILCPECGIFSDGTYLFTRTPAADAAIEYYSGGHSVRETAEKFGVSTAQINNLVKARGATNGRTWLDGAVESNERRRHDAAVLLAERIASGDCEYLDIHDHHKRRAVQYGCEYDPAVTLRDLVKKVGLKCSICGGMCDWSDRGWNEFCGPTYPSIDHIVPMARGGGHVWSNVQVAHMICNSRKGDRLEAV